jgi:hypothetical protein
LLKGLHSLRKPQAFLAVIGFFWKLLSETNTLAFGAGVDEMKHLQRWIILPLHWGQRKRF